MPAAPSRDSRRAEESAPPNRDAGENDGFLDQLGMTRRRAVSRNTVSRSPPHGRPDHGQELDRRRGYSPERVIAPSLAWETSAAYLAITPVV